MKATTLIGCSICLVAAFLSLERLTVNAQVPEGAPKGGRGGKAAARLAVFADRRRKN
jgi:hypothetical protein